MRTIDQFTALPDAARGLSIALGNFDGVHKGHVQVIRSAAKAASAKKCDLGVAVFHPHPKQFFMPSSAPSNLQSAAGRARSIQNLGAKVFYQLPFDRAMSLMSDADFAQKVLHEGLGITHVSVGENYRFGRDRVGTATSLQALGQQFGFSVDAVPLAGGEQRYSSTRVREALQAGDCETASSILGRLWSVEGRVEFGQQRGRTIGVPTANLSLAEYIRPRFGVYAAFAQIEGEGPVLPGVVNIGTRPTLEGKEERLEMHLFDFTGDLYGRMLDVSLLHFLRDEKKFDGLDQLKNQIGQDIKKAQKLTHAYLQVDPTGSS
ncbi:FMN adenylyltransferase / Riboflavin kinase [hydrothermal vent metagenome]|uniref:Bifunctional riboflavin kinase/FMN adenylyltransferase n=1 Tax=hydrothermal vent metagenome TaxID=652676 RepID=A0A3B0S8R4_9ZZZZ